MNLFRRVRRRFEGFDAARYWQREYASGGSSGAGSGGFNYEFKRDYVTSVIRRFGIASVIDFGCGDGGQVRELPVAEYYGLDVAQAAIDRCRKLYGDRSGWRFDLLSHAVVGRYDLALSLDVLYHVTEYQDYLAYLRRLFTAAPLVLIYANRQGRPKQDAPHILWRDHRAEIARLISDRFAMIEASPHPTKSTGFYLYSSFA